MDSFNIGFVHIGMVIKMRQQERKHINIPKGTTNEEIISSFNQEHKRHGDIIKSEQKGFIYLSCSKCAGCIKYKKEVQ